MRRHPEHVRRANLLAVAPTDLKMPLHHSESAARAMDLLLGECERDAKCNAAFPQIRDDWKNALAQLEKQPAHVEYSPPGKAAPTTVEIQRGVFAEKIRRCMYRARPGGPDSHDCSSSGKWRFRAFYSASDCPFDP